VSKGWRVQSAHFHREDSTSHRSVGIHFFDWLHSHIHTGRRNLMPEFSTHTCNLSIAKLGCIIGLNKPSEPSATFLGEGIIPFEVRDGVADGESNAICDFPLDSWQRKRTVSFAWNIHEWNLDLPVKSCDESDYLLPDLRPEIATHVEDETAQQVWQLRKFQMNREWQAFPAPLPPLVCSVQWKRKMKRIRLLAVARTLSFSYSSISSSVSGSSTSVEPA